MIASPVTALAQTTSLLEPRLVVPTDSKRTTPVVGNDAGVSKTTPSTGSASSIEGSDKGNQFARAAAADLLTSAPPTPASTSDEYTATGGGLQLPSNVYQAADQVPALAAAAVIETKTPASASLSEEAVRANSGFTLPRFSGPAGEYGQWKIRILERFGNHLNGGQPPQRPTHAGLGNQPQIKFPAIASHIEAHKPSAASPSQNIDIQRLSTDIREKLTADIQAFLQATTAPTTSTPATSSFDLSHARLDTKA